MATRTPDLNRLPRLRDGLTIRAVSPTEYVVKRSDSREYFSVGPREACLLELLDGTRRWKELRDQYAHRVGESLSEADFAEFVEAIEPVGLFSSETGSQSRRSASDLASTVNDHAPLRGVDRAAPGAPTGSDSASPLKALARQSPLFFRVPLCNPDRFLTRFVAALPFFWTREFLALAITAMLTALCVMIASGRELIDVFPTSPGFSDMAFFIAVMLGCTALHEIAHGATLKRFGGDVHDSGFLFMFFTPCLYCNVSDAWLLSEKWKRLAVTAAGGFCDLGMWAIAVFVWRLTVIGTGINHLAFVVLTICGARSLLNFNPLLRLDGYYLLSDWLSIPNLRPRALEHWMSHLRWLLWGAARPPSVPHGRVLVVYGAMCWVFAIGFLDLIVVQFFRYMGGNFGVAGMAVVVLLVAFGFRRVFKGFFASEFTDMLKSRPRRTALWGAALLTVSVLLFAIPVHSTVNGDFEVRPGSVLQLHVPVTGIVQSVEVEDGSLVSEGQLIAVLRSTSLDSEILKTEDLLREVEAGLARLKAGTRREELSAKQDHVARLQSLHDLGIEELEQARIAHDQELLIQEHRVQETTAQLDNARQDLAHSEELFRLGALAGAQLRAERLALLQMESRLAQIQAATSAARAIGVRAKEAEIGRRAQELADAKDSLTVMLAGTRPEEIAAEEARLQRVQHELAYMQAQREKLQLRAPAAGVFSAPRLKERIGQAAVQDTVFCTIEQPDTSRVEINISEDDAAHVRPGQPVTLKARALAFETFQAVVEGTAATASKSVATGIDRNVVVVHCRIHDPDGRLKSGMTGFGRITRGWNSIGLQLLSKGLKYLRTEFWW